jgi:cytochrome b involved in lipid metabolism
MSETTTRTISLAEIEKHNTRDDIWVVIRGKVYNVSKFVDEHPGGEEVMLDVAGKDATTEFIDVGHSEEAEEILEKLLIGQTDEKEVPVVHVENKRPVIKGDDDSSNSIVYLIISILLAAGAFFYLQFSA